MRCSSGVGQRATVASAAVVESNAFKSFSLSIIWWSVRVCVCVLVWQSALSFPPNKNSPLRIARGQAYAGEKERCSTDTHIPDKERVRWAHKGHAGANLINVMI